MDALTGDSFRFSCLDKIVSVGVSADVGKAIRPFFSLCENGLRSSNPGGAGVAAAADILIDLRQAGHQSYDLFMAGQRLMSACSLGTAIQTVESALIQHMTSRMPGTLLHAGAVGWGDACVLVVAEDAVAVAMAVGCLIEQGFSYHSLRLVRIEADGRVVGYRGPFSTPSSDLEWLTGLSSFRSCHSTRSLDHVLVAPKVEWLPPQAALECRAIVVAKWSKETAGFRLGLANSVSREAAFQAAESYAGRTTHGRGRLYELGDQLPVLGLEFDVPRSMGDVPARFLRYILDEELDKQDVERHISSIAPTARELPRSSLNAPTPPRGRFKLTIGMATYDDFDGVYFTIQSLRLNSPDLMRDIEFIVVDNNPLGVGGDALKALETFCPTYRYIPFSGQSGTATRDLVFSQASGDFVLCMDCHVLLVPGALERLLEYLESNPESCDLYQGPLLNDNLERISTHFGEEWRKGMFGTWQLDDRGRDVNAEPFEIGMQGLGLFACRRAAWPGFNLKFRGFGGEEGYIHEKFRQRGGKVMCLPFLRWLHRFPRPAGVPYRIDWGDRVRNYLIGFGELGLDTSGVKDHFSALLGSAAAQRMVDEVETELANPFNRFGALRYLNLDASIDRREALQDRLSLLGIEKLCSRFPAVATPDNHHVGCALSHRAVIADAHRRGLENVLVLEDDVIFHKDTLDLLPSMLDELKMIEWDVFYLGGWASGKSGDLVGGCRFLRKPESITTTHAVVYNRSSFERILADLPEERLAMEGWAKHEIAIDQYLNRGPLIKILAEPMIAMQSWMFGRPGMPDSDRFFMG